MEPLQVSQDVRQVVESHTFDAHGCWTWEGPTRQSGSPVIETDDTVVSAKLAFYHFLKGPLEDLPEGHSYTFYMGACDNKLCVKPELYSHTVYRQGLTPGPRRKSQRNMKTTVWDRDRALRYYYGHDSPESKFEADKELYHDRICEMINISLNYFDVDQCVPWNQLEKFYDIDTPYSSEQDFYYLSTPNFGIDSTVEMFPLPIKRALHVYWNDLDDYLLLNGFHRIDSSCGDKDCFAPWHTKRSLRTPGTRSAKTEWTS